MSFNMGGAGSGAMSGASAGMSFGPWGAAIGGVAGGLLGGFSGGGDADDIKKAAQYALMQQREAQAYNTKMYNKAADGTSAYREGGLGALPYYLNMASGGLLGESFDITDSPAFTYQQGKAHDTINQRMAAMGIANSSANVNALADADLQLSANEYNNAFNRMAGVANMGLGTEQWLGNLGMTAAGNNSNIAMNGASQYGNLMGQYYGAANQQQNQFLGGLGEMGSSIGMAPAYQNILKTMSGGSGGGRAGSYNFGDANGGLGSMVNNFQSQSPSGSMFGLDYSLGY